VDKTGVSGENHCLLQTLSYDVISSTSRRWRKPNSQF